MRFVAVVMMGLSFVSGSVQAQNEVTLYSYREPFRIAAVLRGFEANSGIRIKVVHAKEGLVERIASEGSQSSADVLLAEEFGVLIQAREAGITQPIKGSSIEGHVPPNYRDPDGHWIGLTNHARVVFASKTRVPQETVTYEELADPKWRGKICIRPAAHTYNLSLIASMIAHHGRSEAKRWLIGLKDNLARRPHGNDRAQLKAIYDGICDLAVVNTYYMGETTWSFTEQKQWAEATKILFPNAEGRGSHVSISGVALMKHAPNKVAAMALIEFLTSEVGQRIYSTMLYAYPVVPNLPASDFVRGWGTFVADALPLAEIALLRKDAAALVEEVGIDRASPN